MLNRWISSGSLWFALPLSLVLHALLFFILSLQITYSRKISIPQTISVRLIEAVREVNGGDQEGLQVPERVERTKERNTERRVKALPDKREVSEDKDAIIEESIHAIKSKKRIEKIVRLRTAISISSHKEGTDSDKRDDRTSSGMALNDYKSNIRSLIHSRWIYPDVIKETLRCTIIFEILMNGDVRILEIRGSGNRLFDYSAKNAILRAMPFPSPPEPLEVEVLFSR